MAEGRHLMKFILLVVFIILMDLIVSIGPGLLAEEIAISKNRCLYYDTGPEVERMFFKTQAALDAFIHLPPQCKNLAQEAQNGLGKINDLTNQLKDMKISYKNGQRMAEVDCNNFITLYRLQYEDLLKDIASRRPISSDSDYHYSHCEQTGTAGVGSGSGSDNAAFFRKDSDGDYSYLPAYSECINKIFSNKMAEKTNSCREKKIMPFGPLDLINHREFNDKMSSSMVGIQNSIDRIFSLVISGECPEFQLVQKMSLELFTALGNDQVGKRAVRNDLLILTGSYGIALSGKLFSLGMNYLDTRKENFSKRAQNLHDASFEMMTCLYLDVQKEKCKEYQAPDHSLDEIEKIEKSCVEKPHLASTGLNGSAGNLHEMIFSLRDLSLIDHNEAPLIMDRLKNLSTKNDLEKLLREAREEWLEKGHYKEASLSNKILTSFDNISEILSEIKSIDSVEKNGGNKSNEGSKRLKRKVYLRKKMQENFEVLLSKDFETLVQAQEISTQMNEKERDDLFARKLLSDLHSDFKKSERMQEGDFRKLLNLTSAMVEEFKYEFLNELERRGREGVLDAATLEKETKNIGNDKMSRKEISDRRFKAFSAMKNLVKDCISLSSMAFYDRDKPWYFSTGEPRLAASLKIGEMNEQFGKTCLPLFCDGGIPIPKLGDSKMRARDFGKYHCRMMHNAKNIYDNLQDTYLEKGTICGKSVQAMAHEPYEERMKKLGYLKNKIEKREEDSERTLKDIRSFHRGHRTRW